LDNWTVGQVKTVPAAPSILRRCISLQVPSHPICFDLLCFYASLFLGPLIIAPECLQPAASALLAWSYVKVYFSHILHLNSWCENMSHISRQQRLSKVHQSQSYPIDLPRLLHAMRGGFCRDLHPIPWNIIDILRAIVAHMLPIQINPQRAIIRRPRSSMSLLANRHPTSSDPSSWGCCTVAWSGSQVDARTTRFQLSKRLAACNCL